MQCKCKCKYSCWFHLSIKCRSTIHKHSILLSFCFIFILSHSRRDCGLSQLAALRPITATTEFNGHWCLWCFAHFSPRLITLEVPCSQIDSVHVHNYMEEGQAVSTAYGIYCWLQALWSVLLVFESVSRLGGPLSQLHWTYLNILFLNDWYLLTIHYTLADNACQPFRKTGICSVFGR